MSANKGGTMLYVWGSGHLGQLGLGQMEDEMDPQPVPLSAQRKIVHVAAGTTHSVCITDDGYVLSWGGNESSQLGHSGVADCPVPQVVVMPDGLLAMSASCGSDFTCVVLRDGRVITFGSNEHGQCGRAASAAMPDGHAASSLPPGFVNLPSEALRIVNSESGADHTLLLTDQATVLAFGQGSFGALGLGDYITRQFPTRVPIMEAVTDIACSDTHSAAVTACGALYTWGKGQYGQLGRKVDDGKVSRPLKVNDLQDVIASAVSCGSYHTAVVSSERELYCFGRNTSKQVGPFDEECVYAHDIVGPNKHGTMEAAAVEDVVCGDRQTFAMVNDGSLFSWGANESGQLGTGEQSGGISAQPTRVILPSVAQLCSGGSHCVAITGTQMSDGSDNPVDNFPVYKGPGLSWKKHPFMVGSQSIIEAIQAKAMNVEDVDGPKRLISKLFGYPAIGSLFQTKSYDGEVANVIRRSGKGLGVHRGVVRDMVVVDTTAAQHLCDFLCSDSQFKLALISVLKETVKNISNDAYAASTAEAFRSVLVLWCLPVVCTKEAQGEVLIPMAQCIRQMRPTTHSSLRKSLLALPREVMTSVITSLNDALDENINHMKNFRPKDIPPAIIAICESLQCIFEILKKEDPPTLRLFYSHAVTEHINVEQDYVLYSQQNNGFSFCKYPCLLEPAAKAKALFMAARMEMEVELRHAMLEYFLQMTPEASPFLRIAVRRENIVNDAIREIMQHRPHELKRPLKVEFVGEPGIDEGGVKKEFFQLLVRDLFDVNYGMFVYNEDTRTYWFNRDAFVDTSSQGEYHLVGILLGMAIHNQVILDLHFPSAVFQKLLGKTEFGLEQLRQMNPDLATGLKGLLEMEGDVEELLCQTFEIEYEAFGEMKKVELIPHGASIPVTNVNRGLYVDSYLDYIFNKSVQAQFDAFSSGFRMLIDGKALALLQWSELEMLVCGQPELNFDQLKSVTRYEGGFNENHPVVGMFWEVVLHRFSLEQRKKLLFFCTGSDRAPVGGLAMMKFCVMKNGDDPSKLPTAHTCFNVIMLSGKYDSVDQLHQKLLLAIENAEGFGLE